jgi:arginyl-tRNA synthetase
VIRDRLTSALHAALATLEVDPLPETIGIERPARSEHGDWSSNVAMASAKAAGWNPRDLAGRLAEILNADPPEHVERVEIAGPGFVNFHLRDSWLHEVLREVIASGAEDYARSDIGGGERVQLEFVSANPTGPLHVGNGWWCSFGDALARVLERCGHDVSREYYVNDTGGQIRALGESLLARRRGDEVPEGGYQGEYVTELAKEYDGPDDVAAAGRWAAERNLGNIRQTLEGLDIRFDEWFSQASIEESEAVAETIDLLRARGLVFEDEGALWLNTAEFGDPRERRVLKKSDEQGGDYTYLAGDIAYHRNKFLLRGFDRVIDIWGADHHGQVASLKAGVQALGVSGDHLEIILGQMISLAQGRMSKRAGNAVPLSELVDDIGPGAVRFLSLMSSIDQSTTLDLDVVRSQSMENPVYYVQYAYARIRSVERQAEERGIERQSLTSVDLSLLTHERELDLLRTLSELPDTVVVACRERAPHKVATWVRELAGRFHGFYHDCRIMTSPNVPVSDELTQARLWLVESVRIGLAIGLDLLGVAAPDRM